LHQTRILLVELPRLVGDIVEKLVRGEGDLEFVGSIDDADDLVAEVERTGADLVVLGIGGRGLPATCDELLYTHCRSRVIALEGDARSGFIYQLLPSRVPLGELAPDRLIDAIRTPAAAWAQR
jgi:DNA-binding NarL/FixJ family response regulator